METSTYSNRSNLSKLSNRIPQNFVRDKKKKTSDVLDNLEIGLLTPELLMLPISDCIKKLELIAISFEIAAMDAIEDDNFDLAERMIDMVNGTADKIYTLKEQNEAFGTGNIIQAIASERLNQVIQNLTGSDSEAKEDAIGWVTSNATRGYSSGPTFISCCLAIQADPNRTRSMVLNSVGLNELALQCEYLPDDLTINFQ